MKQISLLIAIILMVSCNIDKEPVEFKQLNNEISLDGDWTMKSFEFGMGTWSPAWGIFMAFPPPEVDSLTQEAITVKVPGSVQHNLVELGLTKDPYVGDNVKDLRWVEDREWYFVKQIEVPNDWQGKNITLDCNMINYKADVWVNGTWCGVTVGNYQEMKIDVSKCIEAGTLNDIILRLRAPENSNKEIKNNKFFDWTTGVDGDLHERPWVTPSNPQAGEYLISKCVFGWDWGPHIVPIGILQPIKLVAKEDAKIENIFVKTKSISSNTAKLEVDFNFSNKGTRKTNLFVQYQIIEKATEAIVKTGRFNASVLANSDFSESQEININEAKLWWPIHYGDQNLYQIKTQISDEAGLVIDNSINQFGIRTIEKIRNEDPEWTKEKVLQFDHAIDPDLEDGEYDWTFVVNGQKVFVQGMNTIPMDAMFDLSPEIYEYTLRAAAEANVNMLRVWGEGLYETDTFYEICDSLGLLVWQDFWVGSYAPSQDQTASWEAVRTNIIRTRNHPSLVLYCGGNEFDANRKDRVEQINELDRLIKEHDGTREFHKASPHGGNVHGGMGIVNNQERSQSYARFCSEAGYQQSWPPLSDMLKFLDKDQLFPLKENQYWLSVHNSSVASYPEWQNDVYGIPQTVEEVIHTEMMHNIIGWQAQMENTRLARYKVSGCLFWALNDVWPATSWSMINSYGTCKNHYYAFKRAASPLLVTASQQNQIVLPGEAYDIDISVINDALEEHKNLKVDVAIYLGQKAEKVYKKSFNGAVDAHSVATIGKLDWTIPTANKEHNFLVVLNMYNKNNELVSHNEYTCMIGALENNERVSVTGGYFGEYRKWTKNNITAQLNNVPESLMQGEEKAFTINYTNNTDNVIMGLESLIIDLPMGLRFYLDDNYINLLPGESRTLSGSLQNTSRSELSDITKLTFQTDGWNVKVNQQNLVLKTK
ncbi:glycoside hydrolase family 2 protein [Saccharicrinis aurantiacus]|uniref:glycoside hydrolase family 2 protein n=1 Tax=Saccharicrinis aurantiacus TaxID=1849719 RepID=UPI00094FBD5A|nr:glycoside hydrolase family 2 [Saccharicrinis aurantiacus]